MKAGVGEMVADRRGAAPSSEVRRWSSGEGDEGVTSGVEVGETCEATIGILLEQLAMIPVAARR